MDRQRLAEVHLPRSRCCYLLLLTYFLPHLAGRHHESTGPHGCLAVTVCPPLTCLGLQGTDTLHTVVTGHSITPAGAETTDPAKHCPLLEAQPGSREVSQLQHPGSESAPENRHGDEEYLKHRCWWICLPLSDLSKHYLRLHNGFIMHP